MKKTITLSLLLAASAMCAYADSTLEEIYAGGPAITLSTTEQLPDSWTDTDSADSLVSTTVNGAEAGDVLAQINFSFNITGPTNDYDTYFSILSIVSSGGTAYQVATQLESYSPRGSSGKLYIGQNIGQNEDWSDTGITFSYGKLYENASLTLTAGAEAGSVTIALSLDGGTPVSITSTNKTLLTGDFVKLAVGGSSATGSLTVTSVKARKAESKDDDAVPEPTTATLSLLALAGLAARRRRK